MLDLENVPDLKVYSKSMNRFGEIVGYWEEENMVMVELDFAEMHQMPTHGGKSTAAELPLEDLTFFSRPVIR